MEKKIGIIGGMGPMATQYFYSMVIGMTKASCDQDHVNMIILNDCSMPDRTGAILSGNLDEVYSKMLADAKLLEDNGCDAIGITCNTAHFFADMIEDKIGIPVIHMIRETVNEISEAKPGAKVAVLATDGTVKTELYQKKMAGAGLIPYVPPKEIQDIIMYQIYERVKKGKACDMEKWQIIDEHIRKAGCEMAILGCTELSVIKEADKLSDFYADPMRVLAERVITFAGKDIKPEEQD